MIDSGLVKHKIYDAGTGIQRYSVNFTSKASANQRAGKLMIMPFPSAKTLVSIFSTFPLGRAGRTGPGFCFRLFSSAAFANHFPDFSPPEIHEKPIENVVLDMKSMGINRIR